AAAEAEGVVGAGRVVADQYRLGRGDRGVTGPGHQPGPLLAGEQVGQQLQAGADLVVAVGGALHDRRVRAERGVVDEGPVPGEAQVHPEFHAVRQRVQAGGRVVTVESEVQREVVP